MKKDEIINKLMDLKKIASEMTLKDQSGTEITDASIKEVVASVFNRAVELCIEEIENHDEQ
tara:strand:+ start:559 stop:741 length:183 start_codon:yes stop_codon:yes gene_type:complete